MATAIRKIPERNMIILIDKAQDATGIRLGDREQISKDVFDPVTELGGEVVEN